MSTINPVSQGFAFGDTTTYGKLRWSKPYYGVRHLEDLPKYGVCRQISVVDHGACATAQVFPPIGSDRGFTPLAEVTCATVAEAVAWAERWGRIENEVLSNGNKIGSVTITGK